MDTDILERKIYRCFEEWFRNKNRRALLVTGSRQVGKTYSIREFAKGHWENIVELNFYDDAELRESINSARNSSEIFFRLSSYSDAPVTKCTTLFFLDEIQECPEIVTAIKFLVERGDCDYILSGSMLGTELKGIRSAPVGYMNTIKMYPLDFEEFCWANSFSTEILGMVKEQIETGFEVDDFINSRLLNLFYKYLITGGLPEAVKAFVNTDDVAAVRTAQDAISTQYRWDISKYATQRGRVIRRIYDLIPSELAKQDKKFTIRKVNGDSHFNRYDNEFLWLTDAGCALPVYCVSEPRYPLTAQILPNKFKLFASDVGILTYQSGMDVVRNIANNRTDINFGAIYENAVAQELRAHGHELCYFKKRNIGEVDFLIQRDNKVLPIEVKSGKNYTRHVALNKLLNTENYSIEKAIILHDGNVSKRDRKIYLPVYACTFL